MNDAGMGEEWSSLCLLKSCTDIDLLSRSS